MTYMANRNAQQDITAKASPTIKWVSGSVYSSITSLAPCVVAYLLAQKQNRGMGLVL